MKNLKKRVFSPKSFFIMLAFLSLLVIFFLVFPDALSFLGNKILFLWLLHSLSGIGLVILTYRQKLSGKARIFLLLSGFSATGFVVGVVLHNLLYALGTITENIFLIDQVVGFFEGGFFLLSVIACPIGLLVGIVGTIVLWKAIE